MTTRSITAAEAKDLLIRTSTNSATGLIGGPHSPVGYTLSGALRTLGRCDPKTLQVREEGRFPTLYGHVPSLGDHAWYLNTQVSEVDPWA